MTQKKKISEKSAPGLQGVTIGSVVRGVMLELKNDDLIIRASSMSFFFFIALFPTITFFFSLIPYLPVDNYDTFLLNLLNNLLPEAVFRILETTISDIVSNQRGGLTIFNFLMAFIFSSTGLTSMFKSFDKTSDFYKNRNFIQRQLVSLKILSLLSFLLLVSISLVILGERTIKEILMHYELFNYYTYWLVIVAKYILVAFLFLNAIAMIYYYAPAIKKKFRYFSTGAIFSTVSLIILSNLLKFYFRLLSNFNHFYGSLGIVIVCMLFVYFSSIVLLLGFEINNSIATGKMSDDAKH
ncbi:MAG: YihY/virulence factor BrkB family protein [Chitinophagales bacterium]|nr:YihY/virulence factor BrkB family protein [Chitinophagales bacterium]